MKKKPKVITNYGRLDKKEKRELAKEMGKQLAQMYLNTQKSTST